jgi:hypothetical protein
MSALPPKADIPSPPPRSPLRAKTGSRPPSFDQFIIADHERPGETKAEHFCVFRRTERCIAVDHAHNFAPMKESSRENPVMRESGRRT